MRIQMKALGNPVSVRGSLIMVNPQAGVNEDAFTVKFDVALGAPGEAKTTLTFYTDSTGNILDRTFGLVWTITNQ